MRLQRRRRDLTGCAEERQMDRRVHNVRFLERAKKLKGKGK
jgi:hypothetical protein